MILYMFACNKLHPIQAPPKTPQIFRFSPNSQGNFATAERKCTVVAAEQEQQGGGTSCL
jgi:hypothetical protein